MGIVKKAVVGLASVVGIGVLGLVTCVQLSWDKRYDLPSPDLRVSDDPELIARGKYLVHGPAHCSNCHVGSLDELFRADAGEDLALRGGASFPFEPMGTLRMPNLTPDPETGLGRYDDGLVFRMLRHNVRPNGMASLGPMMPFARMADDDLVAIVSYLRSLEPVRNEVAESEWTFMGKAVRVFMPAFRPVTDHDWPKAAPPMEPTKERGEYIARYVANCHACHTNHNPATMEFIGPDFAGGAEFPPMPGEGDDAEIWTRSPNLTPHPTGVLDNFGTVEGWKQRFRVGRAIRASPMHWGPFSRMSDEDLEALWIFFNSLDPIENDPGPTVFKMDEAGAD
jgi:mono/diheme cytochrome c family protein